MLMKRRNGAILLALALLAGTTIYARNVRLNLPGVDQGFAPEQPIAFSHRLHSGELEIACLYCHGAAETGQHAGLPEADICMNCHRFVTAAWDAIRMSEQRASAGEAGEAPVPVSGELEKLYRAVGFRPERMAFDPAAAREPIAWIRVHHLPDFVYFDHRRHVHAGVPCQQCHGPVETMETVAQVEDLTMGWCVNCHREHNRESALRGRPGGASTSCAACHY